MKLTFLGTGTSQGIPVIGCQCDVCQSTDPRDTRFRASIAIETRSSTVIIDTAPEFRLQVIAAGISRLDAVLFTHPHADHLHGIDDVRGFNHLQHHAIPCYADANTLDVISTGFKYIFDGVDHGGGLPQITLNEVTGPFTVAGIDFEPLTVYHGPMPILGYRFHNVAYITDASRIPEETLAKLSGLDVLVLNALRWEPHSTHLSIGESVEVARSLAPRAAYFTHICHRIAHEPTEESLPDGIHLAHDGLVLEVD